MESSILTITLGFAQGLSVDEPIVCHIFEMDSVGFLVRGVPKWTATFNRRQEKTLRAVVLIGQDYSVRLG